MVVTPWSLREFRRLVFMAAAVLVFLFLVASALRAAAAEDGEDPEIFVRGLGERAVAVLAEPGLEWGERQERLRVLLKRGFDLEEIGRFVLGKYWRQASPEERSRFLQLYEDFLMAYYVQRLRDYSGEQIEVEGIQNRSDEEAVVRSRVERPDGLRVRVDWRLRRSKGSWSVVDVVVEGVSLALTHRSEFASALRSRGGIEGLLEVLQQTIRRSKRAPTTPTSS